MTGALQPGACEVWWARTADATPGLDALLSPADLARRARLRLRDDRRRTTVAAALTRVLLGAAVGAAPAALQIDRTCPQCGGAHGRPSLPAVPELHFSVSHSAGWVVVAVHRGRAIGVDVEEVDLDAADCLDALADLVLAPEELTEVARHPASTRSVALTTYWVRKEAVLKATGDGLTVPLNSLTVSAPAAPPRVLRWEGRSDRLALRQLHAPVGCVAALAVTGPDPVPVVAQDAGSLLRAAARLTDTARSSRRLSSATTRSQRYP
jgi:4'-phosphopantetheinyl transferase